MTRLASLLTPAKVAGSADLWTTDPDRCTVLLRLAARRVAAHKHAAALDPDSLTQVAATLAMANAAEDPDRPDTLCLSLAIRATVAAALADHDRTGAADTVRIDAAPEVLAPVLPHVPGPDAAYRWTKHDTRAHALTLAAPDPIDQATARALTDGTAWKGDKPPAAHVRRALGMAPVTGRAATAWTAALAADAARILPAWRDALPLARALDTAGAEGWEPLHTAPRMVRPVVTARTEHAARLAHQRDQATAYPARPATLERPSQRQPYAVTWTALEHPTTTVPAHWTASPGRTWTALAATGEPIGATAVHWTFHPERQARTIGPAHAVTRTRTDYEPTTPVRTRPSVDTARTVADPTQRDSTSRGSRTTSGPASHVIRAWSQRQADRLGVMDGSARRRATPEDRENARSYTLALAAHMPTTLAPYDGPATKRAKGTDQRTALNGTRTDADAAAWDIDQHHDATTARPIPGAGRDTKTGEPFAQVGHAGTLTGTGTAPRPSRPRKSSRSGAVGGPMVTR